MIYDSFSPKIENFKISVLTLIESVLKYENHIVKFLDMFKLPLKWFISL